MGYNAVALIKNADLDRIGADANFGMRLSYAIKRGEQTERGLGKNFRAASIADYSLKVTPANHANDTQITVVRDGRLLSIEADEGAQMDLARLMCGFGYSCTKLSTGEALLPKPADMNPPLDQEREWSDGWSQMALLTGHTAVTVLLDALGDIEADIGLGERFAKAVRDWWGMEARLNDMRASTHRLNLKMQMRNSNDISASNHGNPISIIGVFQPDRPELVAVGQNLGRVHRPYLRGVTVVDPERSQPHSLIIDRIRSDDLALAAGRLRRYGFEVDGPIVWPEQNPGPSF